MLKTYILLFYTSTIIFRSGLCGVDKSKPNVLIILADDLGVNDVSWNNPSVPTKTLGRLASQGVILDNMYTLPICTPSRAALLTGVYPYKYGFQNGFGQQAPEGLPVQLPLLSEQLQANGYNNSVLGKWHVGFCSEHYLPTNRGFNTFSGLYVGDAIKTLKARLRSRGLPKNKVKQILKKKQKSNFYSTSSYVNEALEIIKENQNQSFFMYLSLFTKVYPTEDNKNSKKSYTELRYEKIEEMDKEVKKIVSTLRKTGQYKNTVIIFLSDNPAIIKDKNEEFNFPLRGFKGTLYEGGTKIPGFVHSPILDHSVKGQRYTGLMHMVDVYSTVLQLTNTKIPGHVDGLNHWFHINGKEGAARKSMVYNIDDGFLPTVLKATDKTKKFQIVIRNEKYKLIWGQVNVILRSSRDKEDFGLNFNQEVLELYNLEEDPQETTNLAGQLPDILKKLKQEGLEYYKDLQPGLFRGLPSNFEHLDPLLPHGGATGWCRAVENTTCKELSVERFRENPGVDLVNTYFGTLDLDKPINCKTTFVQDI